MTKLLSHQFLGPCCCPPAGDGAHLPAPDCEAHQRHARPGSLRHAGPLRHHRCGAQTCARLSPPSARLDCHWPTCAAAAKAYKTLLCWPGQGRRSSIGLQYQKGSSAPRSFRPVQKGAKGGSPAAGRAAGAGKAVGGPISRSAQYRRLLKAFEIAVPEMVSRLGAEGRGGEAWSRVQSRRQRAGKESGME